MLALALFRTHKLKSVCATQNNHSINNYHQIEFNHNKHEQDDKKSQRPHAANGAWSPTCLGVKK